MRASDFTSIGSVGRKSYRATSTKDATSVCLYYANVRLIIKGCTLMCVRQGLARLYLDFVQRPNGRVD